MVRQVVRHTLTLVAQPRTVQGSRRVSRLRHEGFIPGVVYGKSSAPVQIMVSQRELLKFLHARSGDHGLLTLRVEADDTPWEKPVLIKAVQQDPVFGAITHIDFHAITLTEQIRVKIPMVLNGVPVGVKQDGGVLEHFLREIEVECLPTQIPKEISYDIGALKIGDAVHVRDLSAPAGARIVTDAEAVIGSVLTPKEEKPEEIAAAVTEPEVIREKKPEAEDAEAAGKEEKPAKEEKKEEKK